MAGEYRFAVSAIVNNIFGSAARVAAAARELLWGVAVHCAALAAPMRKPRAIRDSEAGALSAASVRAQVLQLLRAGQKAGKSSINATLANSHCSAWH